MNRFSFNCKHTYRCLLIGLQVFLQIVFPLALVLPHNTFAQEVAEPGAISSSPFSVDRNMSSTSMPDTSLPYAGTLNTVASSLSSGGANGVAGSAKSATTGYASSFAQQWLSQFGTARVQLNVDDKGNWDESAFDFLAPLYDNKNAVLFTQLGLRAPDGRTTGNVGMGVRTFYLENWMFGGNIFLDDDFTGKNRRVGLGAEAWTNFLKLSANTYVGTTEWHGSRDFDDYDEKPADGYDVRAEGYLPAYPQLGAKLIYEQYYGDKVALFDTDHLQSNPSAVTTGMSYTPIPLVQLAVSYKHGQDSMDDTQFQANFRYNFGHDWRYQINPENVRAERTLTGSRYDLVERNNQIIMQYKKKEQQGVSNLTLQITTDNSPADGSTPNTAQVLATDKDGQPVRNAPVVWSTSGSAKFTTTTAVTNDSGLATVNYTNSVAEAVTITANSGRITNSQNSQFSTVVVSNIALKITHDNSMADGQTANQALATVSDLNGRAIPNTNVKWAVGSPAVLKNTVTTTDANGQVTTDFTATAAGTVMLSVSAGERSASQEGHFTTNLASAVIDTMNVTRNGSPANGVTANSVTIIVKDSSGALVSNANVSLNADKSTVMFGRAAKAGAASGKTFQTDSQGSLTIEFTDTVAETVLLSAALDNGNTKTATASFVADNVSAKIIDLVATSGALANGIATNQATVTLVDANDNPLAQTDVNWSQSGSAVLGTSAKTDVNGKTTVTFTDTKAQTVTITAALANGNSLSRQSTFLADNSTAKVSELTVTPDSSPADGSTPKTANVIVKDGTGNLLTGAPVTFNLTGAAIFNGATQTAIAVTNNNGEASISFTDTTGEMVTLTAKATATDAGMTKNTTFTSDLKLENICTGASGTCRAAANGSAKVNNVLMLTNFGQPVAGAAISVSVSGNADLSTNSVVTDSHGNATVTVTDTTVENVRMTFSYQNQTITKDVVFYSPTVSTLTLVADVNGHGMVETDLNSFHVIAYDEYNEPMENVSIEMSIGSVCSSVRFATAGGVVKPINSTYSSTTNNNGETVNEGYLFSTSTVPCTLSAYLEGNASIRSNDVNFTFSK